MVVIVSSKSIVLTSLNVKKAKILGILLNEFDVKKLLAKLPLEKEQANGSLDLVKW